jgi:branched-chain amino acid transport system ATP-binding protein
VLENVMIGRHCRTHARILGAIFRNPARSGKKSNRGMSFALLERIGLAVRQCLCQEPPYGAQRRLEIAGHCH